MLEASIPRVGGEVDAGTLATQSVDPTISKGSEITGSLKLNAGSRLFGGGTLPSDLTNAGEFRLDGTLTIDGAYIQHSEGGISD